MIKCVVPISGGKDSQCCLKLAVEEFGASSVLGLFCDTKFEHPITYEHVENLKSIYGVKIKTVNGGSVLGKSLKYGRFPGGGARHCTDELKIRETKIFLTKLAKEQGGFEVWYGMRAEESPERAKRYAGKVDRELYAPHEIIPSKYPKYMEKLGIYFKLPILHWTTIDVFNFLKGAENPLYREGFTRVGCFPCLASGDKHKNRCFNHDDFGKEQYKKALAVSEEIGKDIFTSSGRDEDEKLQGCLICSI